MLPWVNLRWFYSCSFVVGEKEKVTMPEKKKKSCELIGELGISINTDRCTLVQLMLQGGLRIYVCLPTVRDLIWYVSSELKCQKGDACTKLQTDFQQSGAWR